MIVHIRNEYLYIYIFLNVFKYAFICTFTYIFDIIHFYYLLDNSVYSRKGGVDLYLHTFVQWASDWGWIEQTLNSRRSPPETEVFFFFSSSYLLDKWRRFRKGSAGHGPISVRQEHQSLPAGPDTRSHTGTT